MDSKWIFKIKQCSDDTTDKYKARLVARGFTQRQRQDVAAVPDPSGGDCEPQEVVSPPNVPQGRLPK